MAPSGGDAVHTLHKILNSAWRHRRAGATIELAPTGRVLADGLSDVRGVLDAGPRHPERSPSVRLQHNPAHPAWSGAAWCGQRQQRRWTLPGDRVGPAGHQAPSGFHYSCSCRWRRRVAYRLNTDASLNTGGQAAQRRGVVLVCPGGRFLSIPERLPASKPAETLLF